MTERFTKSMKEIELRISAFRLDLAEVEGRIDELQNKLNNVPWTHEFLCSLQRKRFHHRKMRSVILGKIGEAVLEVLYGK